MTDLVVVFALFVFMLALLCFCVATAFSMNKDLYIIHSGVGRGFDAVGWAAGRASGL